MINTTAIIVNFLREPYLKKCVDSLRLEYPDIKIIVGEKDEYFHLSNKDHPEEAMSILLKNIPNSQGVIIPGARHSYKPHEDIMAKEVIKFIINN